MKRLLLACFAWLATGAAADEVALPLSMASGADLRGTYRAALCGRPDMAATECARTLRTFGGEVPAARPPAADPSRLRLLFVPGFLASCFAGINSFGDVVERARTLGFAADVLAVGGRNGIGANAKLIAEQIDRLPADGRRLVLIGHSKGAPDLLEMLATRSDIAARVVGLLSVAGALQGSPLADHLYGLYGITLGVFPFSSCSRGEGDAVFELSPEGRRQWWSGPGSQVRTPLYSLVALPDLERLSPALVLPYAGLSRWSRDNDGMLLVQDQVAPGGRLLGVVNADHLSVGIPYPGHAWVFVLTAVPFPRPQVILAAVDVIASHPAVKDASLRVAYLEGAAVQLAVDWAAAEGWNPGQDDARCFAAADPTGFFVGMLNDEPVATISVVKYGATFAFLGLYIVKPAHRGRGYGYALWQHALATAAGRNVGLDGVVAQQDNYRRSGFRFAYRNVRYRGTRDAGAPIDARVVPLSSRPFAELVAYDRAFFAEQRTDFLRCWVAQPQAKLLAVVRDGRMAGYGVIRASVSGYKVGPLFADDASLAEALLHGLAMRVPAGVDVYLDVPEPNAAAIALAERHRMTAVFETARMYTGKAPALPLNRLFGVTTFELG